MECDYRGQVQLKTPVAIRYSLFGPSFTRGAELARITHAKSYGGILGPMLVSLVS